MHILELDETKTWLRIDGDDEDNTINMLIRAAEAYLKNATGKEFDKSNHQAKLFCLVLVADWYENRELIGQRVSDKVRFTIQSIMAQLQFSEIEEGEST